MNLKRKIISTVIFLLLLVLAYFFVFKGYSLTEFKETIDKCDKVYLYIAMGCALLWVFFEALYFKFIFRKLNYRISWYQAFGYVFTEAYFSAITPSNTGGQPVQMVEMNKDKIPYRISTIVVLINTLLYKISLLVIVIIGFFIFNKEIQSLSTTFRSFSILGFILTLIVVLLFIIILFSKTLMKKIVDIFYKILWKLKIKKKERGVSKKLEESIEQYREAAKYIKTDKILMVESFFIIFMQRISLLLINYLIYKAFHIEGISLLFAITIQAFLTLAADFIPVPGGMIISEALLLETNEILGITSIAKGATLLFRNISFYFLVLLSLIYYMIFHFVNRKPASIIENKEA